MLHQPLVMSVIQAREGCQINITYLLTEHLRYNSIEKKNVIKTVKKKTKKKVSDGSQKFNLIFVKYKKNV